MVITATRILSHHETGQPTCDSDDDDDKRRRRRRRRYMTEANSRVCRASLSSDLCGGGEPGLRPQDRLGLTMLTSARDSHAPDFRKGFENREFVYSAPCATCFYLVHSPGGYGTSRCADEARTPLATVRRDAYNCPVAPVHAFPPIPTCHFDHKVRRRNPARAAHSVQVVVPYHGVLIPPISTRQETSSG